MISDVEMLHTELTPTPDEIPAIQLSGAVGLHESGRHFVRLFFSSVVRVVKLRHSVAVAGGTC